MTKLPITRPSFDEADVEAVRRCLESGWVTQGPRTVEFESLFASAHEVPHAIATTSCTAALHLSMAALGIGPGDEVVVPAFTWVTSAHCARYMGADVVFADVDPATFNLDARALEAAITPRTRAVVVVHLFGLPAEMDAITAIAKQHGLAVVEDAACAVGSRYRGRPVGALGDFGCFSFHPRKVITTGEGGMVTTANEELAERVRTWRNHGSSPVPASPHPYVMGVFDDLGFNLRLSDIQAAIGVVQMGKLTALLSERLACARRYDELLGDVADLEVPQTPVECHHTYQSYVIRIVEGGMRRRNAAMDHLAGVGVQTRPGTHAVHRLGYYENLYGLRPEDYPHACLCEDTTITLPIFPGMTSADQERVVNELQRGLQCVARSARHAA